MIKKFILLLFCFLFFLSCGKKGDPVYKESKIYVEKTKIY